MSEISIDNVKALVAKAYLPHARAAFGEEGSLALRRLLDAVKLIYQRCPPESLVGTLTVVVGIGATPIQPLIASLGACQSSPDYQSVGAFLLDGLREVNAVVEVASNGSFRTISLASDLDLKQIAQDGVVYRFDGNAERILAKDFEDYVEPVSPLLKSNFAVPTLGGLEDALEYFRSFVSDCSCRLLKDVWEGGVDGPRLVFVNKPEAKMRDSLAQALDLLLRDVTVKPEQNTDETKPVDIRVNWFGSDAVALIEVKWLGKATAKSKGAVTTYTEYSASRAQSGADQLADYLDREARHTSAGTTRGYLVVFDGRRKGTKGAQDPLSKDDAMAFAGDALTFKPDHAKERSDFGEPVRYFMNPRQSHFLAA